MESILIGLRTQDFHESLKATSTFGPKEVYYEKTLLIGKAATLAMHLRGLLYIDNYDQLKYAAASLGISSLELQSVLRELEEIDFLSVIRSGENIRRIDIRVPEFRSGYTDLGERWCALHPTELERASIETLDSLLHGPIEKDGLLERLGLEKALESIMVDVMGSGLLMANQFVDGVPFLYTPLAVDGNPTAYIQWAQRFPDEVSQVINILRNNQGLPIADPSISMNSALYDAIQTGVLMPVKISGATGDQHFVFAPHGGLSQEERIVMDKARAILSSVRYGQKFASGSPIRSPRLILERLRDYKKFKQGHPDLRSQYGLLTEKLIGSVVDEGNGYYNFHISDTEENIKALNVAIDMLEYGEAPSGRIDVEAQKALLSPSGYQCPATTRPQLTKTIQGSQETRMEIIRQMGNLIRGGSSHG